MKFFLRLTSNNLWQYRVRNLFSVTIICLSFLILGIFLSLSNNLQKTAAAISRNLVVTFYLEKDLSDTERSSIEARLKRSLLVRRVSYVSSQEARERFWTHFPELREILENLKENPFPPSLEAGLREDAVASPSTTAWIEEIKTLRGVADVQFNKDWAERIKGFGRLAKAVGFFLGGILILASFFIISNVIKLNVFARKNEIEILRLVGAANSFIRTPFLLEGIILGFAGSLVSLAVLSILIKLFPLTLGSSLGPLKELVNFGVLSPGQAFSLVLAGMATGLFGSASSVSRFLKV